VRKRKRATSEIWKRQLNKMKRMTGDSYVGFQKIGDGGKSIQNKVKPSKVFGKRSCTSKCPTSSIMKCTLVTEELRQALFESFWKNMDWDQRKVYIASLVMYVPTKRKVVKGTSRKAGTFNFYIQESAEIKLRVCKPFFQSTFGITEKQIRNWVVRAVQKCGIPRAVVPLVRNVDQDVSSVERFLDDIPKMPSHYRRSQSSKEYLEPIINSKAQLYKLYAEECAGRNETPLGRTKFNAVLEQKNISLFSPKNDQCDLCCSYDAGNTTVDQWNLHILAKNRARKEKDIDKQSAIAGKCNVLTMDLESVKLAPFLKASSLYYKTKLCVHNFTVYDLKTHNVKCYWWNESEGDLQASTYASCLLNYIEEEHSDDLPLIIYSDGCTCQNRNAVLSNALLSVAVKSGRVIIQKYLEKGHTQMECDLSPNISE